MRLLLRLYSFLTILAGIGLIVGGMWGIGFTYSSIAREKIVTPKDASIPNTPVRDPLTLKAQADIIRHHTLTATKDLTFAEMPRQIESVDENGNKILDKDGKPVMVPNKTRDMWVTATTLTTALNLGILSYAFSAFALLMGVLSVMNGMVFLSLGNKTSQKR